MTPPSSSRVLTPAIQPSSFPEGFFTIDQTLLQDFTQKKPESLLSSFQKFDLKKEGSEGLLRLFKERDLKVTLKFHGTEIPVDNGPDLKIVEGAALCMGLNSHDGKLSIPAPIGMNGFHALGGFLDFCRLEARPDGRIIMSECPCTLPYSRDITDEVMESPLGTLFPDRRLQPVGLLEVLKLKFSGGSGPGVGDRLLNALQAVHAKIQTDVWEDDPPGTPGGSCHPVWASLELFLDLPVLQKAIREEKYKLFDFSGILEGSSMTWPGFDLGALPLPEGIRILFGKADLNVRYHPTDKKTEILLKKLDAEVLIPELFGEEKVRLKGDASVTLQAGGIVSLHFDGLRVEIPGFPSGEGRALKLGARLFGDLLFRPDPASSKTVFSEAHLKLDEVNLTTLLNKGIRIGNSAIVWGGELQGSLEVDYVSTNPSEPLHLRADLKGSLKGDAKDRLFDLKNLKLSFDGSLQKTGEFYLPNLRTSKGSLQGDFELKDSQERPLLSLSEAFIRLSEARLEAGAKELRSGRLSLAPSLGLNLVSRPAGDSILIDGEGDISLLSSTLPLRIGAPLKISTDLKKLEWSLPVTGEQVVGPFVFKGDADLHGGGAFSEGWTGPLQNIRIKTLRPFEIRKEEKLLAKNVRISGNGSAKGSVLHFHAPSLLGKMGLDLTVGRKAGSDRLWGAYRIKPRALEVNSNLSLKDISLTGNFQTSPISELLEKPKLFVSGSAQGRTEGILSGPLSASYQGSLTYSPEKNSVSLWLNPKNSNIALGPLKAFEGTALEGSAGLQGAYVLTFTKHGVAIGGSKVGLKEGQILLLPDGTDGKKTPLLTGLSFIADQLWDIRGGVAYGGGEGIKIETDLHLNALQDGVSAPDGKRHILYIADQVPISLDGYWRLFKKMQADSQKEGR